MREKHFKRKKSIKRDTIAHQQETYHYFVPIRNLLGIKN